MNQTTRDLLVGRFTPQMAEEAIYDDRTTAAGRFAASERVKNPFR